MKVKKKRLCEKTSFGTGANSRKYGYFCAKNTGLFIAARSWRETAACVS